MDIGLVCEFTLHTPQKLLVAAACHGYIILRRKRICKQLCDLFHRSAAHAAGHHQKMPVRRIKTDGTLCLLIWLACVKFCAHRNAERRDCVRIDSVFHKGVCQRNIRDDTGVQPHAVTRRACSVVRGDKHGFDAQGRILLNKCQHQRREQVDAHDCIVAACKNRRAQPFAPTPQNAAGSGGFVKRRGVLLGVLIAFIVELGKVAVEPHVPIAHKAARALGDV